MTDPSKRSKTWQALKPEGMLVAAWLARADSAEGKGRVCRQVVPIADVTK